MKKKNFFFFSVLKIKKKNTCNTFLNFSEANNLLFSDLRTQIPRTPKQKTKKKQKKIKLLIPKSKESQSETSTNKIFLKSTI